jgi:transcriptional accessory protein Tex/SPT6
MKKAFLSYFSFSRTERIGIFTLLCLLMILFIIRITMHYWVQPHNDAQKQEAYSAAWKKFKAQQNSDTNNVDSTNTTKAGEVSGSNQLVDINKVDSETLVSLTGIGPATAHKILERRKTLGPFKTTDELYEVRHFPPEQFEILKKQIRISAPSN